MSNNLDIVAMRKSIAEAKAKEQYSAGEVEEYFIRLLQMPTNLIKSEIIAIAETQNMKKVCDLVKMRWED